MTSFIFCGGTGTRLLQISLSLILKQFNKIKNARIQYLLEPIERNTTFAIALACMVLNEDEIVFAISSDQLIKNETTLKSLLLLDVMIDKIYYTRLENDFDR